MELGVLGVWGLGFGVWGSGDLIFFIWWLDLVLLCGSAMGWGLTRRWELLQIGTSERALQIMIYSKLSSGFFATVEPMLGVLG